MTENTHAVEHGKILRLSVSQIETFDPSTPFGCNRKWWFEKVARLDREGDVATDTGSKVHKEIEHYLETGENCLGSIALAGKHIIDEIKPRVRAIEREFSHLIAGLPLFGRIDVLAGGEPDEIVDWKTTSDIAKYAKTIGQLRESIQMNGYADWLLSCTGDEAVRVTLVYLQTRGRSAEKLSTVLTREMVSKRIAEIEKTVTLMTDVARENSSDRVPGNARACNMARGCPFKSHCPEACPSGFPLPVAPQGSPSMSLLDRFAAAPVPAPKPERKMPPIIEVPADEPGILPPDAPKSDPALAADPVPGFSAPGEPPAPQVPADPALIVGIEAAAGEKPKRGRKPGSKNKKPSPQQLTLEQLNPVESAALVSPPPSTLKVKTITVRHGSKLNLGNYQSADVMVEMTAEGNEADRVALGAIVRAALAEEVKPYLPKPVTVPA